MSDAGRNEKAHKIFIKSYYIIIFILSFPDITYDNKCLYLYYMYIAIIKEE